MRWNQRPLLRRTKIVATIGPASREEPVLRRLLWAGMDVARLNFSHGTHEEHAEVIRRLRYLSHRLGKPLAILQDLQGPRIRIGVLRQPFPVKEGDLVRFRPAAVQEDEDVVPVDFPELLQYVRPGLPLAADDGLLEFEVVKIEGQDVVARARVSGQIRSHKGINLPGVSLDIPGFTEKDEQDLRFGLEHDVDAIAISFVRNAEDVARVRQAIAQYAPEKLDIPIIAKLERREALENLEQILEAADGVMVARGDLGVEIPIEQVPLAQKRIIQMANRYGRLVITATQMLESMVYHPRPTRAEASDVVNAVLDGADALMLSGETASGHYPVEAVQMMDALIRSAEAYVGEARCAATEPDSLDDFAPSVQGPFLNLALAARQLAMNPEIAALAVFTHTGRTAITLSKTRPRTAILAFTHEERTYRRLNLYWGVQPFKVPFADSLETMLKHIENVLQGTGLIRMGQKVALVAGFPVHVSSPPNFLLVHTLGAEH